MEPFSIRKLQAHIQAQYIKAIGSAFFFFMNACDAQALAFLT